MNVLKVKQQGRTRAAQGSSSLGHLHIARREIRKKGDGEEKRKERA